MSRVVPASILAALTQPEVQPFHAVELLFDTDPVRLWTGHGTRVIEGNNYIGAGSVLTVAEAQEVNNLSAVSATVTLSAIESGILSLALTEPYQRRGCRILFGVVGEAEIVETFSGYINTMNIVDSGETSRIELMVDSKLVELERTKPRRYTNESQLSRYPGDAFFSYVADLQDRDVVWGRARA